MLLAQGKTATEAVRTIGVTEQSYYRWRSEYGDLKLSQVKRLKLLEQENGRLRQAVADLTLEKLVLKGAGHCPARRRTGERCPSSSLRRASQGRAGCLGAVGRSDAGAAPNGAALGAKAG